MNRRSLVRLWALGVVLAVAAAGLAAVAPAGASPADPWIVGGTPTTIEKHPWLVAVARDRVVPYCGGAIVAPRKVLTAAHCTEGETIRTLSVIVGRTNLVNEETGMVARVVGIWEHPRFGQPPGQDTHDFAVLTLDRAFPNRPLPLASTDADLEKYRPGALATVAGWGHVREGGPGSPRQLREAKVPMVSDDDCANAYKERFVPSAMACAGYPAGGIDACQGDSGGPLTAGGKLIGVVSWGDGCGEPGKPGIYAETFRNQIIAQQIRS